MSVKSLQVAAIYIRPPVLEKPTSQLDILLYLVIRPGAIKERTASTHCGDGDRGLVAGPIVVSTTLKNISSLT
jgi:hypothetical protein